ncbi:MAG: hypothetical protein CVU13_10105 [Bacteroidetes bacterium HGW-Bacteroidetes-8]|jgi:hypothetical protein|nr:MAG: hypothetical protein CVU13_10105 [Bacteroidetes bacterium HGW-Bacteroidetes-8]
MVIGGEHVFFDYISKKKSDRHFKLITDKLSSDYNINYTFGGYYSLLAIVDYIIAKNEKGFNVLLPSYLCPSMLKPFDLRGIEYTFYIVDDNLRINIEHLQSCVKETTKAALFIDYFGASQKIKLEQTLDLFRSKSIYIIQDIVQCLELNKSTFFGDFIFNSFRKFLPIEGSLLLSTVPMDINFTRRIFFPVYFKRLGQILRHLKLVLGFVPSQLFLCAFRAFDFRYYKSLIFRMPYLNMIYIKKIDFKAMIESQLSNYHILNFLYKDRIPELLVEQNKTLVPLGLVIKVKNRDVFRAYLYRNNIFAPIHWRLSDKIDRIFFYQSWELSEKIITIPIINLSQEKVNYLINKLNFYFKNYENLS